MADKNREKILLLQWNFLRSYVCIHWWMVGEPPWSSHTYICYPTCKAGFLWWVVYEILSWPGRCQIHPPMLWADLRERAVHQTGMPSADGDWWLSWLLWIQLYQAQGLALYFHNSPAKNIKKNSLLLHHKFCKWWSLVCAYLFHAGNRTFSKSRLKPCYQFSVVLRFASDLLCDKGKNRLFSLPVPAAIQKNRYLQKILHQEALWSFQQKLPQGVDLGNYCGRYCKITERNQKVIFIILTFKSL